jgi:hypothetical protein
MISAKKYTLQILYYLFWIAISFAFAFIYISILIGFKPDSPNGILAFFELLIYNLIIVQVMPIMGSIIALLFILTDIFYLKKKLKNNSKKIGFRFLTVLIISVIVAIIHYLLEKVIDVI